MTIAATTPTWLWVLDIAMIVILLAIFCNWLYYFIRGSIIKGSLKPEEFEKKYTQVRL